MSSEILTVTANPALEKMVVYDHFAGAASPFARPRAVLTFAGGKGVHVARVIRLLGGEATAAGWLAGHTGAQMRALLSAEGLPHHFVDADGSLEAQTRLYICVVDGERGHLFDIAEPGSPVSQPAREALVAYIEKWMRNNPSGWLVLSGSLPPGVPADFYARLVRVARECGVKTVVDTSGAALREAVKAGPFLIKPNEPELAELVGYEPRSTLEVVRATLPLLEQGLAAVVNSRGPEGVILVTPQGSWTIRTRPEPGGGSKVAAPRLRVGTRAVEWAARPGAVQPVGSGDVLVGVVTLALAQGGDLLTAVRRGVAAATVNLRYVEPGYCLEAEVEEMMDRIVVEAVAA